MLLKSPPEPSPPPPSCDLFTLPMSQIPLLYNEVSVRLTQQHLQLS